MYRQGDVLIYKADEVPANMKPVKPRNGRLILAEGEATGHHHSVDSNVAELYSDGAKMVMVVSEPTTVDHQEHGAIEINPGTYWVIRQREYDAGAERKVRD